MKTNKLTETYLKVIKENVAETFGITEKDTFFSFLYDIIDEAYVLGYNDGNANNEKQSPLENSEIHEILVKLEELFNNKGVKNEYEQI